MPEPTPTRAPRTLGPGLGNLTYAASELFQPVGFIESPEGHGNAAMVGGYLMTIYSSDGGGRANDGGFEFWDVSNPRAPRLVKRIESDATHGVREPHGFGFSTGYPYDVLAVQSEQGVQFWDVTDPLALRLLGDIDLPHIDGGDYAGIWWLFFQAPYVYAAGINEGLYIIDAHDPTQPTLAGWMPTSELTGMNPAQAFAVGNLLILAEQQGARIVTLDISDPIRPRLLSSELGAFGYAHFFSGGKILTSGGPQVGAVLPVLQGGEPLPAPMTMGVTTIGHDGSIDFEYFGEEHGALDAGGYGSVQDGKFFSGFSESVAKFDIATGAALGVGSSGIDDRDEDFGYVLGNLIWAGNDHGQGTPLYPHQTSPDTTPPVVTWIHPADGAVEQSPLSRVGVSMSDEIDHLSVDATTFRVQRRGGAPLAGKYSVQMGLVNFHPDEPLRANTEYEVIVEGVRDLVGNPAPRFSSRFSVGNAAPANCRITAADTGLPAARVGEVVSVTAVEVNGIAPIRYTWNFGDGTEVTTDGPTASHTYAMPGRHPLVLTVQDRGGRSSCSTVQVVTLPPTVLPPAASTTIVYAGGRVFNVNADNDTLSAVDGSGLFKLWEAPTGDHPRTLAVAPDGALWVANQDDATITVHEPTDGSRRTTLPLPYASQPYGIAFAPDGGAVYVTLQARRELAVLSPAGELVTQVPLDGKPRGVAVTADSRRILVTRFVSGPDQGEVWILDAATLAEPTTVALHFDAGPDTEKSGRGVPNYITALAISPDGRRAVVPSKKDNVARGVFRDGQALTFETRVRTIVSQIDLVSETEIAAARVDLNDRDMAQAAVFNPRGDLVFIGTQGTNTIEVLDPLTGATVASIVANQFDDDLPGVGPRQRNLAPQGLAIDPDSRRLFVHNFLSRTVTVYDIESISNGSRNSAPFLREIEVVANEAMERRALLGKRLFYNASDPRMSRDGYLSCASCHLDGGSDGQVWDFTQVGEGLRNTIDLVGKAGTGHGNVHWTANFDEIQDFEHDIRDQFSGTGFLRQNLFQRASTPLGPPKARLSVDLDNLAIFVASLDRFPDSPYRQPDGSLTPAGARGREVFAAYACWTCHLGPDFTDRQRHDVGTAGPGSGQGIGLPLAGVGFDTPTLKGVWDSAPYLHDGSAATLAEALRTPEHVGAAPLSAEDEADLIEYLLQIDEHEEGFTP